MSIEQTIRIAYCIPTYKRPELIEEFLKQFLSEYAERGIDVYLYDSSPDAKTKSVAEIFQKQTASLYYFHIPEEVHECKKAYWIFQGYGMEKEYDYIWLCGDGTRYSLQAIDLIIPQMSLKYDLIHLDSKDAGNVGTRDYEDYKEYFTDCGWHTAVFGDIILNCHTMLKDVPWERYESNFLREESPGFAHVCFYFTRFLELPQFRVKHISMGGSPYSYISVLKRRSGWYHRAFEVLIRDFVRDIDALPSCYTDKDDVIRRHIKAVLIENEDSLFQHRIEGAYDENIYNQYKDVFPRVCDVPIERLKEIAFMTPEQAQAELRRRIETRYNQGLSELYCFIKKYPNILIYGAGIKGKRFAQFCETQQIKFSGFVVSSKLSDENILMGHPIYSLEEVTDELKAYGIYLALNPHNQKEVQKVLAKKGLSENLFFNKVLDEYLWFISQ